MVRQPPCWQPAGVIVAIMLVFLFGLAAPAFADLTAPVKHSQKRTMESFIGEEFTYRLQILGATSGESFIRVGKPRTWKGKKVIPLIGGGKTTGFWRNLYRVDNQILSLVDPESGLPQFTEIRVDTEDKFEEYTFRVRRQGKSKRAKLSGKRNTKGQSTKSLSRKVHSTTHDLISWIFALRLQELSPGESSVVYTFSGNYPYRVTMNAKANENVWTPSGTLLATHVQGTVQRLGNSDFKKQFSIWLSVDEKRMPQSWAVPRPY